MADWRIRPIKSFKLRPSRQTSVWYLSKVFNFSGDPSISTPSNFQYIVLSVTRQNQNRREMPIIVFVVCVGEGSSPFHSIRFLSVRLAWMGLIWTRLSSTKTITVHLLIKLNTPEGKIKDLKCCCLTRTFNLSLLRPLSPMTWFSDWGRGTLYRPSPSPVRTISCIKAGANPHIIM